MADRSAFSIQYLAAIADNFYSFQAVVSSVIYLEVPPLWVVLTSTHRDMETTVSLVSLEKQVRFLVYGLTNNYETTQWKVAEINSWLLKLPQVLTVSRR